MTQEDLMNGATDGGTEADGVVRDAGDGNNSSRSDNPVGNSRDGETADAVSQAELVRQFGDEFRRSMQAASDRDGPEVFWKKVYDHMKKAMGSEW